MLHVIFAIGTLLLFLYVDFLRRTSKIRKFVREIGGPPKLPLLGNAWDMAIPSSGLANLCQIEWPKRYGPRFTFAMGTNVYFTSILPSDNEKLLTSRTELDKGYEYDVVLSNWLGQGLLTSRGSKWVKRRKLVTTAFHFIILEKYMNSFNSQSKILVDILRKDSDAGEKEIEICQYLSLCALDIICETAMGTAIEAQHHGSTSYHAACIQAWQAVTGFAEYRGVRPWLHNNFIWNLTPAGRKERECLKLVHGFTDKVIRDRKLEFKTMMEQGTKVKDETVDQEDSHRLSRRKRMALLDLLLEVQRENPEDLNDQDIREEVDTFMFEGHDTTASNLGWTILLLACNPECQEKVIEEIDAVFEGNIEGSVTSQDLSSLKYLECCVKEALRVFPSIPFFTRKLKQDFRLDDKVTVPAGTNYIFHTITLHRNPDIFPDPDVFRPERFFPENSVGRHPFAFIPFSAGSRNCIGQKFVMMEVKVILAHLFRNFRVKPVDRVEDVTVMIEMVARPQNGIKIKLEPRCPIEGGNHQVLKGAA